ncbi:MAG: hypothetical protein E7405_00370 [Ruminococcaceae bacterium]|nr:hypothetical protein [Oscillospiraceae bacterium]
MTKLIHLRERMRRNLKEREEICRECGLSANQLKYKLYNPRKFTLGEIVTIKRILSLTTDQIIKIFAPFVAKRN